MWPRLLDMDHDQCKHVLRRLELEAYSGIVSAFRAQGDLNDEKKQLLRDVASTLSISTERHKAEVRRAVNDEKLTTVAERLGGDNSSMEWSIEGRRLVPLMPRFIPQTVFTVTANQVANMAYAHNATLPDPERTAKREGSQSQSDSSRPASVPASSSNHIVLPPGTVLPKNLQNLEQQAKAHSHASHASSAPSFLSALTSGKLLSHPAACSGPKITARSVTATNSGSAAPSSMKVTFTKVSSSTTTTSSPAPQKVIIMSSPNATDQSTISDAHRSTNLPASTKVTMATMPEVLTSSFVSPVSLDGVASNQPAARQHRSKSGTKQKSAKPVTVVQQTIGAPVSTATGSVYSTTAPTTGSIVPAVIGAGVKRTGVGPQRPEPGMKLITQTVASSAGRMSSKTYQVSASSASPTVRTTTIGLQASKGAVTAGPSSPAMRNIVSTTGPRIVTVPSPMAVRSQSTTSNVITLSPMALQKSVGKSATTTVVVTKHGAVPGKTNVIVVQKSQIKSKTISSPRAAAPGIMTHTTSILTRPKIAMTMTTGAGGVVTLPPTSPGTLSQSVRFPAPQTSAQKPVRGPSPASVGAAGVMGAAISRGRSTSPLGMGTVIGTKAQVIMRPKSPIAQTMTTLSAPRSPLSPDLDLQGKVRVHRRPASISPTAPGSSKIVETITSGVLRTSSTDSAKSGGREPSLIFQTGSKPNSEWIEYDGSPSPNQSASSAIKALLEFRGQPHTATSSVKQVPISGVVAVLPSHSTKHASATTRHLPPIPSSGDQRREPVKSSSVITVEVQGRTSERLEFSPDQLSSVVDQFEQFLEESEETEERPVSGGKRIEVRDKSVVSKSKVSPTPKPADSMSKGASCDQSGVRRSGEELNIDPFEFVEDVANELESSGRPRTVDDVPTPVPTEVEELTEQRSHAKPQASVVAQPTQMAAERPLASVVMETAASFDISQMNMEDLSCQRMREDEDDADGDDDEKREDDPGSASEMLSFQETSSGGSGSEGMMGADGNVRVSRRKRKAPTPIDEETGPSSMPSWARAAWNLLQRVMRFRGANRPKGGINAASWFTRPVDPSEAPGYHKVIKKPMDFGTIKRNLEAGTYADFGEFHQDMMLVRSNCLQYNPPGHAARRDCEEVFQFYSSEYSKTLDRWQKQILLVPKSPKRLRPEPPMQP